MNIFMIGAAAAFGSRLTKGLSVLGYRVSAMDIDTTRAKRVLQINVPLCCCAFGAQSTLRNVFKGENVSVVIQCPGKLNLELSIEDPMACYTNNALCKIVRLDILLKKTSSKIPDVSSVGILEKLIECRFPIK
jgi:UDP-glucose 4-epimerase